MVRTRFVIVLLMLGLAALYTMSAAAQETTREGAPPLGLSAEVIEAYRPEITRLRVNPSLLHDRVYRRVNGAVSIHEAPNGAVKNTLDEGFNFITVRQFAGDWTEISPGSWVRTDALTDNVPISEFSGVLLPEEPLEYTLAWVLVNTWPSLTPGAEGYEGDVNRIKLKYQVVHIFDSVEIDEWRWYQIGVDQWIHQTRVAKVLPLERPEEVDTERWVSVDLYEQVLVAYEGSRPVFATLIASGLPQWATNEGLFHIYVRYERTIMTGSRGQPDFYYLQEVPWTMYYDNDIALHGAYWHDAFGYRRSHGCVNMSITDSHWLYNFTSAEIDFTIPGDTGAAVYVYSSDLYK